MTTSDDGTPLDGPPPVPPVPPVPPAAPPPVPPVPPPYPPPGYQAAPPPGYPTYPGYPPAYPQGPGQYADYGPFTGRPSQSGMAVASLILGIVGLCLCGFLGILAIVLGLQARKEIAKSGGAKTGDGLAIAGLTLGAIGVVLWVVLIAFDVGS